MGKLCPLACFMSETTERISIKYCTGGLRLKSSSLVLVFFCPVQPIVYMNSELNLILFPEKNRHIIEKTEYIM
jgi:hypothetical protein